MHAGAGAGELPRPAAADLRILTDIVMLAHQQALAQRLSIKVSCTTQSDSHDVFSHLYSWPTVAGQPSSWIVLKSLLRHAHRVIEACCSQEHVRGAVQIPLAQIFQAYKSVLQDHGIAASEDTHYYRLLIALSLRPESTWWAKLDAERQQAEVSSPRAPLPRLESKPVLRISSSPALQQEPNCSARQDQATPHAVAVPREEQGDYCSNLAASGHSWRCSLRKWAQGSQSITSPGAAKRPEHAPDPLLVMPAAPSHSHAQVPHRAGAPQLNARHEVDPSARHVRSHGEERFSAPHAAAAAERSCPDQWQEVAEAFLASRAPQHPGSRDNAASMVGRQKVRVQGNTLVSSQLPSARYHTSSPGMSPDSRRPLQQRPLPGGSHQSAAQHHECVTGDVQSYAQQVT